MICTAVDELMQERLVARSAAARQARERRRVTSIDDLLDDLEERHLLRDRTIDRPLRARLRELEEAVGLPLPRKVVRARNTVRLHAALLDWQDVVLDEVVPGRRDLLAADVEIEDEMPAVVASAPPVLSFVELFRATRPQASDQELLRTA